MIRDVLFRHNKFLEPHRIDRFAGRLRFLQILQPLQRRTSVEQFVVPRLLVIGVNAMVPHDAVDRPRDPLFRNFRRERTRLRPQRPLVGIEDIGERGPALAALRCSCIRRLS